jgi:hypothetical protein
MGYTGDALLAEKCLIPGDFLRSPSGEYVAIMQGDGNFVLYKGEPYSGEALWATDTLPGEGDHFAKMQPDGNFVLYHGSPHQQIAPYWATDTDQGHASYFLRMQDDGNLVIYKGEPHSTQAIWATNTVRVDATIQPDSGNFEEVITIVKLETLLALAFSARDSGEPGSRIKSWMNAWLGPHWILTSTPGGIEMYMKDSTLIYSGRFSDLLGSRCARYHITEMNKQSTEYRSYLQGLAADFGRALSTRILSDLPPQRVQSDVQDFFERCW